MRPFAIIISSVVALATSLPAAPSRADVVLDPTSLTINLYEDRVETDRGVTSRYQVRADGVVAGEVSRDDRLLLAWAQGGKALSTLDCELDGHRFECRGKDVLEASGAITATLSYVSDERDETTAIYTMNLQVGRFWNWYVRGTKTLLYPRYQLVPMDLLGSAAVIHQRPDAGVQPNGLLRLVTWTVRGAEEYPETPSLRCSVDGKRLGDFEIGAGADLSATAEDWRGPDAPKHPVTWERRSGVVYRLYWGTASTLEDLERPRFAAGELTLTGDHPGLWTCDWRGGGKVIRTFSWRVGADGMIAPHAEQAAGFRLPERMVMIDVTVPESAPDPYFDADVVRRRGFFGRAWSDPATGARLVHARSRPGAELAAPAGAKPAAAGKGKGKGKGKRK